MTVLSRLLVAAAFAAALVVPPAGAGPLRDLAARRAQRASDASLPAGTRVLRDVAYGADPRQRLDVYLPAKPMRAPVVFMVHGGGWRRGDKAMASVVDHKVARWVPRGFIVVSVDYRMLPDADPLQQARDVARALAFAQGKAVAWGGDHDRVVLMGHSAGAHLVALLSASPALLVQAGARRPLGSVLLDSAALDVPRVMQARHYAFYDEAFGTDPAFWRVTSPLQQLGGRPAPLLAVCSSRRSDSCPQADAFVAAVRTRGTPAAVLREDLSHREINELLGARGAYTDAVERFLAGLDADLARRLR